MSITRSIVIYGNTLALAGIALALERHSNWKVITLEEANLAQQLKAHSPNVIIFDASQTDAQSILSCAEQSRDLLAIGIEPNSDRMLMWSGHSTRALTIQDLTQAIDALPESINRFGLGDQVRQSIRNRMTLRLNRRQKLAMGIGIIGLCLIGLLGLAQLTNPVNMNLPLAGTATSEGVDPEIAFAFGVGGVFSGGIIGLFFWLRRHNHHRG